MDAIWLLKVQTQPSLSDLHTGDFAQCTVPMRSADKGHICVYFGFLIGSRGKWEVMTLLSWFLYLLHSIEKDRIDYIDFRHFSNFRKWTADDAEEFCDWLKLLVTWSELVMHKQISIVVKLKLKWQWCRCWRCWECHHPPPQSIDGCCA